MEGVEEVMEPLEVEEEGMAELVMEDLVELAGAVEVMGELQAEELPQLSRVPLVPATRGNCLTRILVIVSTMLYPSACEKGQINHCSKGGYGSGGGGYGKDYCYGSMEGEYCTCDFCKCKTGMFDNIGKIP